MKVLILYRPNSEHDTMVMGWVREYKVRTTKDVELVSLDTREGADMARLYDIVQYPTIVAIEDNGALTKEWQGDTLPLISEVSYYDQA
jgi:hypothetical protein